MHVITAEERENDAEGSDRRLRKRPREARASSHRSRREIRGDRANRENSLNSQEPDEEDDRRSLPRCRARLDSPAPEEARSVRIQASKSLLDETVIEEPKPMESPRREEPPPRRIEEPQEDEVEYEESFRDEQGSDGQNLLEGRDTTHDLAASLTFPEAEEEELAEEAGRFFESSRSNLDAEAAPGAPQEGKSPGSPGGFEEKEAKPQKEDI